MTEGVARAEIMYACTLFIACYFPAQDQEGGMNERSLGPYQIVIWNLETDPPTYRVVDLTDPRPGFIASFNKNAGPNMRATDSMNPPPHSGDGRYKQ